LRIFDGIVKSKQKIIIALALELMGMHRKALDS